MRDLGTLTPAQQAEFELWLKADKRHLGAYARAEGALVRVERAYGWARGKLPPAVASGWTRRRLVASGGVAAGLAAAGIVGAGVWLGGREQVYATDKGEVREVLLSDGSVIKLNTKSKVAVRYTDEQRNIRLLEGEVLFDVAKNKARPFVVQANDTLVRAVGTSFTVSALPKEPVRVLVKEGIVEIKHTAATSKPVRARANSQVIASLGAPITAAPIAQHTLARSLAWEYGRIAFDDQTLRDAANAYARYSDIQITVDPAVANLTITGSFVSNDPIGFARTAAQILDLQVEIDGREVKIFR